VLTVIRTPRGRNLGAGRSRALALTDGRSIDARGAWQPWERKARKPYRPHVFGNREMATGGGDGNVGKARRGNRIAHMFRASTIQTSRLAGRLGASARVKNCISVFCGEPVRFPPWDAVKNGRPPLPSRSGLINRFAPHHRRTEGG
jgi:hypothetical protein